jgi:hypothetical protein
VSVRTLAVAALAVAVVAALVKLPHDVHSAAPSAPSHDERTFAPLHAVDLDPRLLVAADAMLPRDAVYTVVTGNGVQVSSPITEDALRPLAGFWLLPRRQTAYPRNAQWVLSFGRDLSTLGIRYRRVVTVGPQMAIGEVRP